MEDKALLALLEEDPEEGMPLLRKLYAMPLSFAVSRRLKEPSDIAECVDDALTDFYLRRERFDAERGSLYTYLLTIAERKAIGKYREEQRRQLLFESSLRELEAEADAAAREELRDILALLPEQDRELLTMKYFHGFTLREIAARLDVEYEAMKKRHQRALRRLRQLMEE